MIRSVRVQGLTKRYSSGGSTLQILAGLDLELEEGESLAIVGRSGAGKSTLLHLLGLLDAPDEGKIEIDGAEVVHGGRRVRDRYRLERIGFVFQFYHLLQELNAVQNVLLSGMMGVGPITWWGRRRERLRRAEELLDRVGLGQRLHHVPAKLSGGERQRVAIARVLAVEPDLIVADEPTSMLDVSIRLEILALLHRLRAQREVAFLFITHDLAAARYFADRILVLCEGRLVEESQAEALVSSPRHPYAQQLVAAASPGWLATQTHASENLP